jgi:hypothetical protein
MKFQLSSEYGELSEVRNMVPHHGIDLAMADWDRIKKRNGWSSREGG